MALTKAPPRPAYLVLALGLGALTGYVDVTATDVQAPALVVLLAAGLLGALEPRWTWLWTLVIGLSIPGAHLAFWLAGLPPPYVTALPPLVIMPVIFAFAAALAGALARWALTPVGGSHEH